MTVLRRLPRWARTVLLAANLAAALGVLIAYWLASYPNLIAAWAQGSVLVTLAPPAMRWLARVLDAHHERTLRHVDQRLASHATAHDERIAAVSDQVAAVRAKLDRQGGAT